MFVILFCFLATSFIFAILGKSFVIQFDKTKQDNYTFTDSFFIGLCLAGSFLNIWSLFLPTNFFSLLFLSLLSCFLLYINFKILNKEFLNNIKWFYSEKKWFYLIVISLFLVLLYALVLPRNYDSYLYHINAIQWNEFYRVVPGLANFHDRLGFNSSIFVLSAGFSFSNIYNQYIFILNSLSFFIFFIWLLKQIYFKRGFVGLFSLLFLYLFIIQYAEFMSSPGTDLLPNLFVGFLLLTLLFYKDSLSEKGLIYIVLPMFCITLKLSTFPIILITLFAIYVKQQRFLTSFSKLFLFGTLFIVPWIIRNIILSGYLIYPNVFLDFFNFDWKVPKEKVIVTQSWIYSFGRIPFKHYEEVLNVPFKEWIVVWWDAALLKNKYLYILALLSPLFYSFSIYQNRKEKNNQITLVLFVAYLSCFIWLITAPDIRFSASFVIILALFPLYLLKNTVDRYKKSTNIILLIGFCFVFFVFTKNGFNFFDEDYNIKKISTYAYLPLDVSELKDKKLIPFKEFDLVTKRHESIKIFSSIGDSQTFDKFPCTVNFSFGCGLRGNSLRDGFYSK